MIIPAKSLSLFVAKIFEKNGVSAEESERIGRRLVSANLTGHDSHGVIRVPRYVNWLLDGTLVRGQNVSVVSDNGTIAVLDGHNGFGQSVGEQAVQYGIDKAKEHGVGIIGLRNAGHLGRIGDWAEMAVDAGLISLHFVNVAGSLLVAPFGGIERRMSTNPVTIGVPRGDEPPLILDFATSIVAEGKVLVASKGGKALPDNALVGPDGVVTGDPKALYGEGDAIRAYDNRAGEGAIRAMGDHKGSGLALMCEILAGALTGGGCAGPDKPKIQNGMLSIYLSIEQFGSADAFSAEVRQYLEFFSDTKPADPDQPVLMPGEPEQAKRKDRGANGIELPDETWASIMEAARNVGLGDDDLNAALAAA
ncbi:MAG: malate/lactate/ureidoglycolate dehydrogenase [Alphaproteobacteria bacterium]|nr:malate/lactate/ureidoglycolate dehydrogenase [Alphaproteobacteria bacterium]MBT4019429.1 malate/lactate/ureidoglycolate dehydrogenase [Alphaproteobacteria bacterium]MBT4965961.1 malate/lactate/ureidoglycolate dehydrogenase [Alphaproteobacteria bacterium]MBT5160500.1 malate/lactate/ureidoglycolate dehydrogenase [Alphaproteobacteria bacterium]MBT5919666.1 malate/lactate/ureidoglycolate dehydrogenase [Alphaproteobacteria bacterium]